MSIYLDTSVFVALFVREQRSADARALWLAPPGQLIISAWTLTEYASAIALKARLGAVGAGLLLSPATPLRAGDALHLAICTRLKCELATFDQTLANAAVARGVTVKF